MVIPHFKSYKERHRRVFSKKLLTKLKLTSNALNFIFDGSNFVSVDLSITQRSFQFGKKYGLPQYFVSAADGTNVVKVGEDSLRSCAVCFKATIPLFKRFLEL